MFFKNSSLISLKCNRRSVSFMMCCVRSPQSWSLHCHTSFSKRWFTSISRIDRDRGSTCTGCTTSRSSGFTCTLTVVADVDELSLS